KCLDRIRQSPKPPATVWSSASDQHGNALGIQGAAQIGEGTVSHRVVDDVVPLPAVGEILLCVIDDMVRADRADQVHIPGAAHAGYLGAEYLRDLHGEGPHTSRSAIDQDLLSRLDLCLIAKALQRGERRDR